MQKFVVEGEKIVSELAISSLTTDFVVVSENFSSNEPLNFSSEKIFIASQKDFQKISSLKTPQNILAVAQTPAYEYSPTETSQKISLLLDHLQDPGNLGTIIRIADWFGIENIFCSTDTVDLFNPKTIQASMGAIFRVKVHYVDLPKLIAEMAKFLDFPVYGTFLEGENIYSKKLSDKGFIIIGNEANGISFGLEQLVRQKLYIPNFSKNAEKTESLNAAISAAIVCSEFRR